MSLDISGSWIGTIIDNSMGELLYPLDCAPMETLKTLYLSNEKDYMRNIPGITSDRSSQYIPESTEIIYK